MSVALYMAVHVRWAITAGLRRRGVDVLTAQEDGAARYLARVGRPESVNHLLPSAGIGVSINRHDQLRFRLRFSLALNSATFVLP